MILINKEILKSTGPCTERWKNYLEYYSEFNGSFDDFLNLDKISYDDKIWVTRKVLNKNQLIHWAVLCAESVLSIYENKYPNDKRISDCLTYMKGILDFSSMTNEQRSRLIELRSDCYSARNAAGAAYAAYAAYAAAYAAYAADAAAADAYAAAADAAYAAADAAADAYARENQRSLNLQFLKMAATL